MIDSRYDPQALLTSTRHAVVGMHRESELVSVALSTGRHVLLEGPPGTGKSTLLRTLATGAGVELVFVEGNAELTPSRLVGHHDPALVLAGGYSEEAFVPGPLARAVKGGGLLYLEELNRVPEETLNVLITALAEGELHVPRYGRIEAAPGFRLIAAMNPFDSIGTSRIGQAIYDRMCRVAIGYQSEVEERAIVDRVTGVAYNHDDVEIAVALVRATRVHPDLRVGSSVRGAVDQVLLCQGLRITRPKAHHDPIDMRTLYLDAALTALSGRVRVDEATDRLPEAIITELLDAILRARAPKPDTENEPDDPGKAEGPGEPPPGGGQGQIKEGDDAREAVAESERRSTGRSELAHRHRDRFDQVSPEVGQLDEQSMEDLAAEDPDAAAELLADLANATDADLRAKARKSAARLFLRLAQRGTPPTKGVRRIVRAKDPLDGDLDLDATLSRTDGRAPTQAEELVATRWGARERAICLLVDRSGSMSGRQVATAAVGAASVIVAAGERADVSVIAFARDSIVLASQGRSRQPEAVISDVLSLRGKGVTDLGLALRAARRQLGRAAATQREVILLSDGLATEGEDPFRAMEGIDRLHVVGTSSDEDSVDAARRLAKRGGGRYVQCTSIADLSGALNQIVNAEL
jgi:MoxR-like ATPase/Mg-chelatase subunit ChlD